ncbi:TPA: ATP-binding cassette domain-containing protein, partial [Pluralibacter gergoviae]
LLTRLIALESQLAEDLARKPRHQKPERQIRWRQEIDALLTLLEKR